MDLNDVIAFRELARHGGFAAAERETGLPRSTLSRRLARLEGRLGVRLVRREARGLRLTAAGEAYRAACEAALSDLALAETELPGAPGNDAPVRLTAPSLLGQTSLPRILAAFRRAYPDIPVALDLSNGKVDLAAGEHDLALRVGDAGDPELVGRVLAWAREGIHCAPAHPVVGNEPREPSDLLGHDAVACRPAEAGRTDREVGWALRRRSGEETSVLRLRIGFWVNDPLAGRAAVIAGLGVASLPEFACTALVASGRLVRLLPDWSSPPIPVRLLAPEGRAMTGPARLLRDWITANGSELLRDEN